MKKAVSLLPIVIMTAVLAVWMMVAGASGRSVVETEFAMAQSLVDRGIGTEITVESTGQDVTSGGRRSFPKWCFEFEYETASRTITFKEKRWCEAHFTRPVTAELVYRDDLPEVHYWADSEVTRAALLDGPNTTFNWGVSLGVVTLALSSVTVVLALLPSKRKTPPAEANGVL